MGSEAVAFESVRSASIINMLMNWYECDADARRKSMDSAKSDLVFLPKRCCEALPHTWRWTLTVSVDK